MSVEDVNDVPLSRAESQPRRRDAFADVPIASPEGSRPSVERVRKHGALFYGPATQDGQAAAERAGVVEFPVGQDALGGLADGEVVILNPAFLETYDMGGRIEEGDLLANLEKTGGAEGRDVQETPAVEGQEGDLRGRRVGVSEGGTEMHGWPLELALGWRSVLLRNKRVACVQNSLFSREEG